ncbi:alpha/beta fold hydrolase [Micromonospora marina]|uniref:alpha/beta fold hydrolase n=1 Tax=Micromonospora marina TaxID=307120 RepID=UPI0034521543
MSWLTVGADRGSPVDLYYEDHGEGRPVVLVHGWPISGRCWEHQVEALVAAGYRVVSYDRRGFGRSGDTWFDHDVDTFAADLVEVVTALGLRDSAVVGWSAGATEVVRAITRGGLGDVRRAVLAAPTLPYLYRSYDNPQGTIGEGDLAVLEDSIRRDRATAIEAILARMARPGDRTDLVSPARMRELTTSAAEAAPQAIRDGVDLASRVDLRPELGRVCVPTLIVHGGADVVAPLEATARRAEAALTDARLVVIPDAPHLLQLTHAALFNGALLAFLSE